MAPPTPPPITFTHRLTPAREEYSGMDAHGREWVIFRHRRGAGAMGQTWFVWVILPNETVRTLTMCVSLPDTNEEVAGVLYDRDASDLEVLMAAVRDLIQRDAPLDDVRRPHTPRRR